MIVSLVLDCPEDHRQSQGEYVNDTLHTVFRLFKGDAEVHGDELLREREDRCQGEHPDAHTARRENGSGNCKLSQIKSAGERY